MDNRSWESGASATPPSPPSTPSSGYPVKGNPSTGTPATKPGQYWFHQIGEEMRNLITAAGLTPSNTDLTQLQQAIQQLIVNGGAVKMPVRAATVGANITLSAGAPNTLDGVSLAANDRILVKDQTTGSQNGIYVVTTLGTGVNGTWTRATDDDTSAEMTPGLLVVVQEGAANADTEWELVTNGPITLGTTALTFTSLMATGVIQGAFKNLQASATGLNANVTVTVDEVAVENSGNNYQTLRNVSLTIAGTAVGANGLDAGTIAASTWYSLWVIWNGTTVAGLMSTSATAPTLPSGYTHKARVGWIRTDGTANKYPLGFKQYGRHVQYVVAAGSNLTAPVQIASGVNTATTSLANFVPPTAAAIYASAGFSTGPATGGISTIFVAPNAAYTASNAPIVVTQGSTGSVQVVGSAKILLEASSLYYSSNVAPGVAYANGWEDII